MAQIRQVVSESLQATIRRLLPSQQGFTEDLQATNVITPIIDLTPTAEGSLLDTNLQTALSYGDITAQTITTPADIIVNTGFWRVFGTAVVQGGASAADSVAQLSMTDGVTPKVIFVAAQNLAASQGEFFIVPFDFNIFLASGEKLTGLGIQGAAIFLNYRQIADISGNLVNPTGFTGS